MPKFFFGGRRKNRKKSEHRVGCLANCRLYRLQLGVSSPPYSQQGAGLARKRPQHMGWSIHAIFKMYFRSRMSGFICPEHLHNHSHSYLSPLSPLLLPLFYSIPQCPQPAWPLRVSPLASAPRSREQRPVRTARRSQATLCSDTPHLPVT